MNQVSYGAAPALLRQVPTVAIAGRVVGRRYCCPLPLADSVHADGKCVRETTATHTLRPQSRGFAIGKSVVQFAQVCAGIQAFPSIRVIFDRKADAPICWKRCYLEEADRVVGVGSCAPKAGALAEGRRPIVRVEGNSRTVQLHGRKTEFWRTLGAL